MASIGNQPLRQQTPDRNVSFTQDFLRTALNQITTRLNSVYSYSVSSSNSPAISAQSVLCNSPNGYGSSATVIRRWSKFTSTGNSITFNDSATSGSTFTINTPGIYSISYSDVDTGATFSMGISVNSTQLTTPIESIDVANRLLLEFGTAGVYASVTVAAALNSNDVIRAHTDGGPNITLPTAQFSIMRIS